MRFMAFWCWACNAYRTHIMKTDELGNCMTCATKNFAPTGDTW